jgi:hypothetical protein
MDIALHGKPEELVSKALARGEFSSAQEVVEAALELANYYWNGNGQGEEAFDLPAGWNYPQETPEQMREHIARGLADVEAGRVTDGPAFMATLKARVDRVS